MPDDRDVLKRKTPPAGVRAQTAPPAAEFDEDDLTPIEGDSATQTLKRSNQAAISLRQIRKDLKQSVANQETIHRQVRAYAEKDQKDHLEMKDQFKGDLTEVKNDIREVKNKVEAVSDHVGNVRTDVAKMTGRFEEWMAQNHLDAANDAHEERVKLTYKYGVKTAIWKTVLKGALLVAGPIATGMVGYYLAKLLH